MDTEESNYCCRILNVLIAQIYKKFNLEIKHRIHKRQNALCPPHLGVALHHGLDDLSVDLSRTTGRLDVHSVGVHVPWTQRHLETSLFQKLSIQIQRWK